MVAAALQAASRIVRAALFACVMLAVATPLQAQQASDAEYRIKAAFLYHFLNYVDWPPDAFESPQSPLVIGIAAPQRIREQIDREIGHRNAHGRPVVIRELNPDDPLESMHAIYLTRQADHSRYDMQSLARYPVLVITEEADGLVDGGTINFVIENDRVRFDISPKSAKERRLDIGAQLLTVARRIEGSNS